MPITVPNECIRQAQATPDDAILAASSDLSLIAFYYLLRVGEYTKPRYIMRNGRKERASRTKQFSVENVGFFKDGAILPRSSPLSVLLTADSATLKITNQKNGRMGQTIHQRAIPLGPCPVQALARRVAHILDNGGTEASLLCDVHIDHEWISIESSHIISLLRKAVASLHLDKAGIDPDLVGAHSLRAGGAMALKLHGFDDTTIMKMGRWTSLTFLQYVHEQIAHLSTDISQKMSIPLPFVNIAAIETHA